MRGNPLDSSRIGGGLKGLDKDNNWRLALLVAPAGAGKTKALQGWARQRTKEHGSRVAWLSLQPEHNHPRRFLNDLKACLDIHLPDLDCPIEAADSEESCKFPEGEMIQLINSLVGLLDPLTLVLDNYELIHSDVTHQAVKLLIEYLPPKSRLVIASSTEPPLQQARLRARRQLLELEPADLQDE